jgi:DNA polymerase-3 subunit chi
MTRIDFYHDVSDKLLFACRLAAKAVAQEKRVLVFAPDRDVARTIDHLLWTWQATGFLPHCHAQDPLAAETPILVADDDRHLPHDDVLLNLHHEQPAFFSRFHRLIEIVASDDADRGPARTRFRFYRDRGYEIHRHDMSKAGTGDGR